MNELQETRKKNARNIFLTTFFATFVVSLYYFLPVSGVPVQFASANIQLGLLALVSLISLWLNQRNTKRSVSLLLGATALSLVVMALHIRGLDVFFAVLILAFTFGTASNTLKPKDARKAIYGSFVLAIFFILLYVLDPLERPLMVEGIEAWIVASIFLVIYLLLILQRFSTYALRTKLILAFILLSYLGITVAFGFSSIFLRQVLIRNAEDRLLAGARSAANNVDAYLLSRLDTVATTATYIDIRGYLLLPAEERKGTPTEYQVQNLLYTLANRDTDALSYALLDINGLNIVDSNTSAIGSEESDQEYFNFPLNSQKTFVSSIQYLEENSNEGVFFFSSPVQNDMGNIIGVFRAKYRASALQELLVSEENIAGEDAFSVLFDSNHIVLAHARDENLIGKIAYAPSPQDIANLRKRNLIPASLETNEASLNIKAIEEGLNKFAKTPFFSSSETPIGVPVTGAVAQLKNIPWLIISAQPQAVFLAPVQTQARRSVLSALILTVLAAFSGVGLTTLLVRPISNLQDIAKSFSEGNLDVVAKIETEDEIGSLARTFNNLSTRLRDTFEALEDRVEERTRELEQRSAYLVGAAEVGSVAATITDIDELAIQVVELIRKQFNLYYVGLFLLDEKNEWAVLKAGTGQAGEIMLKNNHRLKVGDGMIGWTAKHGESRIALDVGEDAVRFENPVLPETRSEGALPLRSRGRVLGAITIQSTQPAAFTPEIIATLEIMADQVAIALDNAALFAKSEAALEAERRAYGQLSQEDWLDLLQRHHLPAYISNAEDYVYTDSAQMLSQRKKIQDRSVLEEKGLTALIPIKIRGKTLGGIRLRKSEEEGAWTKEQIELAEVLAGEVSIALESARLFDQSQRQAAQERVVGQAAARMRETLDIENVLKIAAEELHKALGKVQTEVWISPEDESGYPSGAKK